MGVGNSWGGGLGVRTESGGFGTDPGAPSIFLPINSESLSVSQNLHQSGAIWTSREMELITPTTFSVAGDIQADAHPIILAMMALYLNGAVSSAAHPHRITTAPVDTPAAGGSLVDGTYLYKVAAVVTDPGGRRIVYGASAESGGATTSGSNNTVDLTWTDPTTLTLDTGYTYYGTAIYRTETDGASDSQTLLTINTGTGASYSDTGSVNDGSSAASTSVPVAATYRHTYTPAAPVAGTNPLNSFAATVLKDLGTSIRFNGCRVNQMSLSVAAGPDPVGMTVGVMAQQYTDGVSNPSPSPTVVGPLMAHRTLILIGGTQTSLPEGFDLTVTNNLEAVPSLDDNDYVRQIYGGLRGVSGTLRRAFEDWTEFSRLGGSSFGIISYMHGDRVTASTDYDTSNVFGQRYGATISMSSCHYSSAMGNLSGADRMVEDLPFVAEAGSSTPDILITVDDATASHS